MSGHFRAPEGGILSSIVLKLTETCNLDCTYCYMFNSEDKTYTRVPKYISLEMALQVLNRIDEYLQRYPKAKLRLVLHGGEPSLWPEKDMIPFLKKVRDIRDLTKRLSLGLQTNLYEYDPALLRRVAEAGGSFGVSLDGPEIYNDARRVTRGGSGSYARVMANLVQLEADELLPYFGGVLSVADPEIVPETYFEWIRTLPKKSVSILWPIHYNYDTPPQKDYGTWFAELFKLWTAYDDPSIHIRIFRDVLKRMLGSTNHGDSIGGEGLNSIVVNTDGQYERHDYLRFFADGAVRTGYNVMDHSIDTATNDTVILRCAKLRAVLPKECEACIHKEVCGGGFVANRLGGGELNLARKSVMCEDHRRFFDAVHVYMQ